MQKKIVIIEDDADIIELMKIIFRSSGYTLVCSQKILEPGEVTGLHPDLVLLDVRIPQAPQTGDELCAQLKSGAASRNIPVVLVSAERELASIAGRCGADAYLMKPFESGALLATAHRFLS